MTPENLTPRKIAEFKKGYISVKCLDAAFLGSAERLGLAIPCPRAYEESADSLHCSGCTAYRASGTPASMKAPVENRMEAAGAKQPLPTPCHDASGGGLHWPMPGITFGSKRSTGSGAVLNAQRGSCEAVQYGSRRAHSDRQRRRTSGRANRSGCPLRVETLWRRHNSRSRIAAAKFRGVCACRPRRSSASIHFHFTHIPADCVRQSLRPFRREMSATAAAVERTCNGQ